MASVPNPDDLKESHELGLKDTGSVILIVASLGYAGVAIYFCSTQGVAEDPNSRILACVLLSFATVFSFVLGLVTLKAKSSPLRALVWVFLGCELLKIAFLLRYRYLCPADGAPPAEAAGLLGFGWFGSFATVCAIALAIGAFLLISRMVREDGIQLNGNNLLSRLLRHLGRERILGLLSFLVVFLYVTYFLAFALAFHDKATQGGALFTDALAPTTPSDAGSQAPIPKNSKLAESCRREEDGTGIQKVFFDKDSASLDPCVQAAIKNMGDPAAFEEKGRFLAQHLVDSTEECPDDSALQPALVKNVKPFVCIASVVREIDGYRRVRLRLVGHATEPNPSRYRSNYELSAARVQQVHLLLSDVFTRMSARTKKPVNLDWLLSPASHEKLYIGATPSQADGERSVEIDVQVIPGDLTEVQMRNLGMSPEPRSLLDYLYFMIYTITTTGYGDIKPTSPQAKFICSLANLLEVFFLVVVFNVLVSFRNSTERPPAPPPGEPGHRENAEGAKA